MTDSTIIQKHVTSEYPVPVYTNNTAIQHHQVDDSHPNNDASFSQRILTTDLVQINTISHGLYEIKWSDFVSKV